MATEAGTEVQDNTAEGGVQTQGEGEAEKPKEPSPSGVTAEMIEQMRAENAQLRELATKAQRDAAASQEYAQRIISEIQIASQRGTQGPLQEPSDLRDQLNENPEAVLDHHFYTRMRPLIEQNLGYQVNTAKTLFEQRHQNDDDYKAYKDELDEFMKAIPPEVKANPAAWDNAMDFVRAKHLNEIVERRTKKQSVLDSRAFVEQPSGVAASSPKRVSLSDDQKAIAKGLGLSEDEYKEFMTP